MRLIIKTKVDQNWSQIQSGFNEDLFLQLNPPLPKVKLKRFDGSQKGDVVSMELDFLLWKDTWTSIITHDSTSDKGFDFIDEGQQLPFPFKKWKHHHIIKQNEDAGSEIIDDITYHSAFILLDLLLYPLMFAQFLYRGPIYKRVFGK